VLQSRKPVAESKCRYEREIKVYSVNISTLLCNPQKRESTGIKIVKGREDSAAWQASKLVISTYSPVPLNDQISIEVGDIPDSSPLSILFIFVLLIFLSHVVPILIRVHPLFFPWWWDKIFELAHVLNTMLS
jgi:hypothetical protein